MQKILICDDDTDVVRLLKTYCELDGYEVSTASNGAEAIKITDTTDFDLIIMDVMMPQVDGFEAVAKIREKSDVAIVMLTAKSEEYDKLHGFNIGIDDFIVKPFSPIEVMARLKAILKRTKQTTKESDQGKLGIGTLVVNTLSREVKVEGKNITLTPKEFDLLVCLLKNKNQVLTREQLLNKIWGFDYYGDARTIDTHIKSLRERLSNDRKYIKTVWGVGYKLEEDEE